jgi:uncharacterized protein (DUF488 family)
LIPVRFPLATIGYESAAQSAVIAALRAAGVTRLIDVRAIAASRRAGFSKTILDHSLAAAGIAYTHLRPLGTPKAGRQAVRRGDVGGMQRIFAAHMEGDAPRAALAAAIAYATSEPCCLLCYEHDPAHCHRTLVATAVAARTGLAVRHLSARA